MRQVSIVKKTICVLLTFSFIFQGCTVYRKTPVTLQEAVEKETQVRIKRTNGKQVRFLQITKVDTAFYGTKRVRGQKVQLLLDTKDIESIRVKNKTASLFGNIGIVVGTLGVAAIILIIIDYNNHKDDTMDLSWL